MSKLLPYLIAVALGISLVFLLKKKLANMNRPVRIVIKGIALLIPFFAYFGYTPIFQGDFSNNFLA